MEKYDKIECPRCGNLFYCTGDMNCWCLDVEVPEYVREYLARHYEGCLCEKCLNELKKELNSKDIC